MWFNILEPLKSKKKYETTSEIPFERRAICGIVRLFAIRLKTIRTRREQAQSNPSKWSQCSPTRPPRKMPASRVATARKQPPRPPLPPPTIDRHPPTPILTPPLVPQKPHPRLPPHPRHHHQEHTLRIWRVACAWMICQWMLLHLLAWLVVAKQCINIATNV